MSTTITNSLKKAVRKSGQSNYAISKATGIDAAALGRFMAGRQSLRLDLADKLATHFGMECRLKKGQ